MSGGPGNKIGGSLDTGDFNVRISMQALETTMANILVTLASIRTVINTVWANSGVTPKYYDSAATTNATSVTAVKTIVRHVIFVNTTATAYYFKIYNKASAPTVGTDVPVQTLVVRANTVEGGLTQYTFPSSALNLSVGFAFALTAGVAGTDNTNAVTGIGIDLGYS